MLSRRAFLGRAAVTLAFLGACADDDTSAQGDDGSDTTRPESRTTPNQPGAVTGVAGAVGADVIAVGQRWLTQFPATAEELQASLDLRGSIDADEILDILQSSVRNDFRGGDTAVLDGWILSKTEGRVAALLTLLTT